MKASYDKWQGLSFPQNILPNSAAQFSKFHSLPQHNHPHSAASHLWVNWAKCWSINEYWHCAKFHCKYMRIQWANQQIGRFNLRPYVIWKMRYPTGFYFFLELHISYRDCRPTDTEAEKNVYNQPKRSEKSFYWIYLFHTVLRRHIGNWIIHPLFHQILWKWGNSVATNKFCISSRNSAAHGKLWAPQMTTRCYKTFGEVARCRATEQKTVTFNKTYT